MNKYDIAVRAVRDRRRADLDAGRLVWQTALADNDRLYAAFTTYQAEMIKNAKGEKNALAAARSKLKAETAAAKLDRKTLEPPCRCKLCGDTGITDGRYCKCVIRSVIQADKANLSLPITDFDDAERTAPPAIKKAYAAAREYIAEPSAKPFFTLVGNAGTGKTVLAAATATALMQKGMSAVTVTAFDLVRRALDYHTQFSIENYTDRFTPMLDCDVLVIDDLGKENMLKNVTLEYLYAVVNERWLNKKNTIITSNLTPDAILARYGEAITSRLLDKNLSRNFMIKGKNARLN